jgi:hypothetical protein
MHQTTHERLIEAIFDCEEQRERALAAFLIRHGLDDWPK